MRKFVVKISRAGMPTVRYTALHYSAADALVIAMDIAAKTGPVDMPIGLSAKEAR